MTDTIDEEDDGTCAVPGLTAGDLRKALEGVPADYPVILRVEEEDGGYWVGSVLSAEIEGSDHNCHFEIYGCDDAESDEELADALEVN